MTGTDTTLSGERADLLANLARRRHFLRFTVRDLTDEQAAQRTTVSELCLGGLIKHVAATEEGWVNFITTGPEAMAWDESRVTDYSAQFRMAEGETLAGILADYDRVARRTGEVIATLPSLDDSHPLPEAPWFERGARWTYRQALLHIIAETAHHCGHADIIRESIDGAKTMG